MPAHRAQPFVTSSKGRYLALFQNSFSCDVMVCGGGPSGIAAAVSAARNGADTLLVERYGFLGGMATAGSVNPFMTRYAGGVAIIEGVFDEIVQRLTAKGAYNRPRCWNSFDKEYFKIVADEICIESGVRLLFHSFVSGAKVSGSTIEAADITNKSGVQKVDAKVFIDATGDADLACLAGAKCEKGRDSDGLVQPMTLCFRMGGIDIDRLLPMPEMDKIYLRGREEGKFESPKNTMGDMCSLREGEMNFNLTRIINADATKIEDLTRAEIEGRRQIAGIVAFLVKEMPGFENAYLEDIATQIGIRETRRVIGDYVMTAEDIRSARKFDDCIARGSYPVDIHDPKGGGTVIESLKPGESYDLPYRALTPLGIDNLLVAGRPISSTHEAHSAIRIMPICAALGEAAGAAAALCSKRDISTRELDVADLQRVLINQGANLGEHVKQALGL